MGQEFCEQNHRNGFKHTISLPSQAERESRSGENRGGVGVEPI